MSKHYTIAILGAGPGGYIAALKAAQMGARVVLVEKDHLGGTCLNNGCIPSKAILGSAELMHRIQHAAAMGLEVPAGTVANWGKIQARKDKILQTLRAGIKGLLGARKATVLLGRATLAGAGRVVVSGAAGVLEEFTADKIILAVGSVPSRIPGWPTDTRVVCTSDEALHWQTLPRKLLIVGGGVIGCEFACMMQPLGVEVTMVEMLPQILPNLDGQVAQTLRKILVARGIRIFTGVKIESLALSGAGAVAKLSNGESLETDRVLVATGRRPNTADIGLETIGLTTERGFIRVNDRMETVLKDYYCIGDANGRCLLAHAASAHGVVAVENALGQGHEFKAPIPNAVYTFPEVGTVGLTAEEAQAQGFPVAVGNFPLSFLGKALAVNDPEGFVKVVRNRETGRLLGVHMIGHNATECIAAAGALLHQQVSVQDIAETVFAHPTISEGIKEAAEDALAMGLHLPPRKFLQVTAGVE
ncbi:MAG: dihydrolipoyl dehydrogenase [Verrucomicrobia bacterium]|nr:dihydrolipoyl dehydrogenase [Verrucomicrobiota bacterium]OQC26938.1 MAG: Dihydrolipoyl dehydrogenase [Verrucomicrobia bacterium ADurb.Bin063]MBP8016089.1 dihydrolipoyl dehydrogenase [Verrucomicrobiota bacterium]HOC49717.1 dihydrolipoyl dehydrogenase [Verrucomicrobiota bacterium]HPW91960.1 dihydrolipoyl dehydrogenase [Verrucomicrobiota bacterium]